MISVGVPSCRCPLLSAYFKTNGNCWDCAVVAVLKVNISGTVKGLNSDLKKKFFWGGYSKCLNLLMNNLRLAPNGILHTYSRELDVL